MAEMKVCTCCKQSKNLAEFHRFGKDLSRVGKWCEECYLKKKGESPTTSGPQSKTA